MAMSSAAAEVPAGDVVVVGSGPNGLVAAVALARAGLAVTVLEAEETIGGGARTLDLGLAPGIRHDLCSAVHPMALASPFFRAFDLAARGVELLTPEASYAQPLDAEPAAIAWHDLERTAADLGLDGPAWRRWIGGVSREADLVTLLGLSDKRSVPRELLSPWGAGRARLRRPAGGPGHPVVGPPLHHRAGPGAADRRRLPRHRCSPHLAPAATAGLLASLAHAGGWPIPRGGSQAITDALVADLETHGGRVITGHRVDGPAGMPRARAVLLDTTAAQAARLLTGRIRSEMLRALRRFPHGDGAAKVDLVLSGPIPWRDAEVGRAGTQHLGGTRDQMAAAEAEVAAGLLPERPVTLVSDPAVVDPERIHDGLRPVWAYAHVPADCPEDPTELVLGQLERFAPGVRDLVVASRGIPASRMSHHNPSLTGGDIAMGRISMWRMIARPTARLDPWHLGAGAYLCSGATPPGPGVHGMSGWFAAQRVLSREFGIDSPPSLAP